MQKFEKGFFIGAATAAHQVEGNNTNSDYWAQEQLPHSSFTEPSGIACDHYHRYEEDIKLLADAGLNAYRFSIEWARVEPEEGKFDPEAIEHYRKVIACCKAQGVEPIATLLHFTSPKWLICKGGWEAESTVEDFKKYVTYVMEQLGSELRYVCTINEANMGLQLAAISKRFRLMAEQAAKNAAAAGKSAEGTVQVGMNFQKMMENMKFAAMENAQVFGTPQPQIFVSERTPEGDLLVLREGDRIAADARLLNGQLEVDESLLTGESVPVARLPLSDGALAEEAHDARADSLHASTVVTRGVGLARVLATAGDTAVGRIGAGLAATETPRSPLQLRSRRLVRALGALALLLATAQVLSALDCEELQGYHFSRPLPVQELEAWACQHQPSGAPVREAAVLA